MRDQNCAGLQQLAMSWPVGRATRAALCHLGGMSELLYGNVRSLQPKLSVASASRLTFCISAGHLRIVQTCLFFSSQAGVFPVKERSTLNALSVVSNWR